jgi:hypothetical protein
MGIWGFAGSRFRALDGCVTDKSCGGGDIFLSVTRMQCPRCHREMTSDEPVYRRVRGVHIREGCAGCSTDFPPAPPGWSHAPQWRAPSPCKRCGRPVIQDLRRKPPKHVACSRECRLGTSRTRCAAPRCWRSAYVSTRSSQGSRAMSSHRLADAKARMKIVKPDILSGGHIGPPGLSEDEGEFVWYPPSAGATRACRGLSRPRKRRGSTAGEKIIRFRQ